MKPLLIVDGYNVIGAWSEAEINIVRPLTFAGLFNDIRY